MPSPRGCFKTGCLGCLGTLAVFIVIIGVMALLAWNDSKNSSPVDEVLAPLTADSTAMQAGQPGRVVLNMAQGEFRIHRAEPGEGLRVEAVYDDDLHDLEQQFSTLPDSSWQFELDFRRTKSGMRAFLQSVFSKGPATKVHVFLPPDVPVELVAHISRGGVEGDLGGLWLTSADIRMHQGGIALQVSEPMKEAMSNLRIKWSQGGGAIEGLGNASPKVLDISSSMGGAEVDLDGAWRNDCDVNLSVKMGGMAVIIPKDVKVLRGAEETTTLESSDLEIPEPVLRIRTKAKYGEIEIVH